MYIRLRNVVCGVLAGALVYVASATNFAKFFMTYIPPTILAIGVAYVIYVAVIEQFVRKKAGRKLVMCEIEINQLLKENLFMSKELEKRNIRDRKLAELLSGTRNASQAHTSNFAGIAIIALIAGILYTRFAVATHHPPEVDCEYVMNYIEAGAKVDRFYELIDDIPTPSGKREMSRIFKHINLMAHPDKIGHVFPHECHENITQMLMKVNQAYTQSKS